MLLIQFDSRYVPLYYKIGRIYQQREQSEEAIECYQTIVTNYPNSTLAPKAAYQLKQMGISVTLPKNVVEENE